jgi:chromosomal replication initiation ATPase DnaA
VFRHKKDADAELRRILARAAKAAGVTEEMMRSCSRRQNIAFARHVYCWIATENDYAPETVARLINRRRATVYNSRKEYQNLRGRFQPFDLILQRLGIETEGIKKAS